MYCKNVQKQETEPAGKKKKKIKSKTNCKPKKDHDTTETFIKAIKIDVVKRFSDKNKLPKIINRN